MLLIELLGVFTVLPQTACSVFLGMGESNCAWNRKALLHRDTMLAAAAVYGGKGADHSSTYASLRSLCPVMFISENCQCLFLSC